MSRRLGLKPDWIEDLLGIWAASDAAGASGRGLGGASPMFKLWGVVDDQHDDTDDSYSQFELIALRAALERLQLERQDLWLAIVATFKPWRGDAANETTRQLAAQGAALLADWIDRALG